MKFNLKMIAAAAAMASLAGAAQAAIVTETTDNGSFVLTAFNPVTKAWYMRDLGFTMNTFLPTGALASVGDPTSVLVGDKTPNSGLTLNASNTANFGDPAGWTSWITGQTLADIRWNVNAVDTISGSGGLRGRFISSSANNAETSSNSALTTFTASSNAGSASFYFGTAILSSFSAGPPTGIPYQESLDVNFGLGADGLATLGQGVSLFYAVRTTETGSSTAATNPTRYGNTTGFATVTLAANGDFTYELLGGPPPAEVPLPAAAWLLGAGLMGVGAMIRRRKAAAEA